MAKTPPGVYDPKSLEKVAVRLAMPEVIYRIAARFAFLLGFVAIAQAVAIFFMLPLKEKVPYFVEARQSGDVVASDRMALQFSPEEKHLSYFLWNKFIAPLLTIDERTKEGLQAASQVVRGAAVGQMSEYLRKERVFARMIEDPTLRQYPEVESKADFFSTTRVSGTAVFWVQLNTTSKNSKPVFSRKRVTVDYVILPLQDDAQVFQNPMGLYITGFRIDDAIR